LTKRVAILISGGGSNMVSLVRDMMQDDVAEPVVVLSNDPNAGGLHKARDLGVATDVVNHKEYADRDAFENALASALEAHAPDIICLAGFMRVLTGNFINRYPGRILNIHPSLLPEYKGLHTHQRALDAGESVHGCSVHLVTAKLDDGPILGQATVPVLPDDTVGSLSARVLTLEHELYPAVLRRFARGDQTVLKLP